MKHTKTHCKPAHLFIALILVLISSQIATAQKWVEMMQDPNANFYEVQKEFYAYWKGREIKKGQGYNQFKRWEYNMQSRVDKNGKLPPIGYAQEQLNTFQARHAQEKVAGPTAAWSAVGPNTSVGLEEGVGRIQCFAMHPSTPNTYWAGTPSGGLWKSTDAGVTWVPKTDNFVSLGISWILIDPTNVNVMYVSTGDPESTGSRSTGVLKSMDGGDTWVQTGLNFFTDQGKNIYQLQFLPGNSSVILALTSDGIYRTANSGTSWTVVKGGAIAYDIEFHPTTPNIVYAATSVACIKSVDSGVTWTDMTSVIVPYGQRTSIEVTANAPDNVYCLTTEKKEFKALFKSTNKGVSFTNTNISVAIGEQAWYDLTFKISPINQNTMYIGGVEMKKSVDGGITWTTINNIHADQHNMFTYGSKLFICNDGGLYRSTDNGTNWTLLAGNMQIMQFYRISSYKYNSDFIIAGAQDNGTSRLKNTAWKKLYGGDGMDNCISAQTPNVVWISWQNGNIYKSTDGGNTNIYMKGNIDEEGGWVTPIVMSPINHDIVYAGYTSLWKTTDGGTTWTKATAPQEGRSIDKIVVDWNNPAIIYASAGSIFNAPGSYFKTSNGGATWTNISTDTGGPHGSALAIDPENSNRIWAAQSGYNSGKKIYYSSNGGTSWINISGTFPDVPINVITYVPGSNDGIYVGTDVGIFYKDATMSDWMQFNNGLPNVRVDDLEINIISGKILAGTYGRGVWESPLRDDVNAKPIADFDAATKGGCSGSRVKFINYSANATSWTWTFPGGTPASSTLENPTVTYNTNGTYGVTLVATNTNGNSTKLKSGLISISGEVINTFPYVENFDAETVGSTTFTNGWFNGNDDEKDWFIHTGVAPTRVFNPAGPTADHTTGSGKYMLFESLNATYSTANLYSPCISLNNVTNPILEFYEHVWSADDQGGELHVDILSNGVWSLDVIPVVNNIGDFWFKKTIDLAAFANQTINVRFRALSAYNIDFALDDISIKSKQTAAPVANFLATIKSGFIGLSTQFYDQSANEPTSYAWSFPGGTPATSTLANPTVIYNTVGVYDVSLTATNAYGSHTTTKTAYMDIYAPEYMNNQTVTGCMGIVYDPGGPNGDYSNNESKTFTIIPVGTQQVVLDVEDWGVSVGDYLTVYDGTSINAPVIASWTGGFVRPYTITSNSGAMTLKFTSDASNVNRGFTLQWNGVGGETCSPGSTVQKPVAAFSSSTTTGVAPVSFTLQDNSSNNPTGWTWITPGATNEYNYSDAPIVTYNNPGTYNVTLIAVNEGGRDTLTKSAFFTVTESIPDINMFTGTVTTCKGNLYDDGGPNGDYTNSKTYTLVIQPADAASVSINFSEWGLETNYDFLKIYNGTSVSYPLLGSYNASNPGTVTANSGAMTLRFTSDRSVTGIGWKASWTTIGGNCSPVVKPVANFSATPLTVAIAAPVQFTDLSTNAPTIWSWSFTGGTPATSTAKNPSVTYATSGTYAVSLTTSNSAGANTITKSGYITVTTVGTVINMQNATVTTCTGTLYDDGGESSNYTNNKTYTLVIQPAGATSVSMNFSEWGLEKNYDFLKIYNGTSVSAPLLGVYNTRNPGTVTANSGKMTLRFTSDAAVTGIGWKSTWTAVGCTGASFNSATGIESIIAHNDKGVFIFPNPTDGNFKIVIEKNYSELIIKNFLGQVIEKKKINDKMMNVDLSVYPKGIYFIELSGLGGTYTEKLILQ